MMADVRIDTRGVPKGPVYEEAPTVLHRQALTIADSFDPMAASAGVNCAGYRRIRFDIDTIGSNGLTALKVQILNWNSGAGKYFRGADHDFSQQDLAANPQPALEAEVRGATVFLKVVSATATSLLLNIYATPS
jgi:hypothetical protein